MTYSDMNHLKLKLIIPLLGVFSLCLQNCKNDPASHPESSLRETGEEFSTEALTMVVDTSVTSFENIPVLDNAYQKGILSDTRTYYVLNGGKTRWLYQDIPSRLFAEYMQVLDSIDNDGLNPETYRQTPLKKAVDSAYVHKADESYKVQLDKEITASFLLLTKHLTNGRFLKKTYGKHSWLKPKNSRHHPLEPTHHIFASGQSPVSTDEKPLPPTEKPNSRQC